jgi:hypothetical protein
MEKILEQILEKVEQLAGKIDTLDKGQTELRCSLAN